MKTQLASLIPSLGFVGAGNMATALLRGTVARALLPADRFWASDVNADALAALAAELSIHTTDDNAELIGATRVVVLAVKPQILPGLLDAVGAQFTPDHLVISIAAGIPLARIAERVTPGTRLVRVMPNTPSLVGTGAAGVAAGPGATANDMATVLALFEAVGLAVAVDETQIDAVTALSGSGPAYAFRLMELMSEAGCELGLPREVADQLAVQTVLGAGKLAAESDETPAALRERVTSPGGTTAAALAEFERRGLGDTIRAGLTAARDRSVELSKG
jgi:pyrroline-5-carboxylate reductase